MKGTEMFCSACDRQVRVMISDVTPGEHQATVHDEELICLEIGEHCTGNLCPLGAAEPNAMVSRIMRNGLPTDGLRTVMATCPACDLHAEIVLYGQGKAACTACGTPARWVAEHVMPLE